MDQVVLLHSERRRREGRMIQMTDDKQICISDVLDYSMQSTSGTGPNPDLGKDKTIHSLSNPCAPELALDQHLVLHHSPSRYQIPSTGSWRRADRMIPEECPAMLETER